jgi:hypothetical protein
MIQLFTSWVCDNCQGGRPPETPRSSRETTIAGVKFSIDNNGLLMIQKCAAHSYTDGWWDFSKSIVSERILVLFDDILSGNVDKDFKITINGVDFCDHILHSLFVTEDHNGGYGFSIGEVESIISFIKKGAPKWAP